MMKKCMCDWQMVKAIECGCDVINYSYGEACHWDDAGLVVCVFSAAQVFVTPPAISCQKHSISDPSVGQPSVCDHVLKDCLHDIL